MELTNQDLINAANQGHLRALTAAVSQIAIRRTAPAKLSAGWTQPRPILSKMSARTRRWQRSMQRRLIRLSATLRENQTAGPVV